MKNFGDVFQLSQGVPAVGGYALRLNFCRDLMGMRQHGGPPCMNCKNEVF